MASTARRALVIGGGIGGLTAAAALRQIGIEVDVVEIKKEWTVYGVGILQASNALRALARIGVAQECVERGYPYPCWRMCDPAGNLLAEVKMPLAAGPEYPANNGIGRRVLHDILVTVALGRGAKVRTGTTATKFDQNAKGVRVSFSDGSTSEYDVVVASDGVWSTTRKMLFPDAPTPTFTGQSVWRFRTSRLPEIITGHLFYGRKSKAGFAPMDRDTMYLLLVTQDIPNSIPEPRQAAALRERLMEYSGPVGTIAARLDNPANVSTDSLVLRPIDVIFMPRPWRVGRIVLIGDAIHAVTPHLAQGASMAIEDAVVLAEMLKGEADVPAALEAFEKRRFDRCKLVYDVGNKLAEWENREWEGRPDPAANPGQLFQQTLDVLGAPI